MGSKQSPPPTEDAKIPQPGGGFTVAGQVKLEGADETTRDLKLKAYVFDPAGRFLGSGDVDAQGRFTTNVRLSRPAPVEVLVGPPDNPDTLRRSSAQRTRYTVRDWTAEGNRFRLKADVTLPADLLVLFRPLRICVSGHVRKIFTRDGQTQVCPVPFVKVEIFDVDREGCWWPYLVRHQDKLAGLRVARVPDLLKTSGEARFSRDAALEPVEAAMASSPDARVGETKALAPAVASRLENLTLTSLVAPWIYFPNCFYSKALVCETQTDCDGYFNCCFPWWLLHVRRGRLRVDSRPDIIIRLTQSINGIETVIYMDPYTSTRWNVTNTHVDLFLDDEAIVCGGCAEEPLPGTAQAQAAILQIGSDPVWLVDQADGKYKTKTPAYSNGAYGGSLYIRGNFTADLLKGSPKRYYQLSWAPAGSTSFKPIGTTLSVLRASFGGQFDDYVLGPQPAGSPVAGLYEVQDTDHMWMMPGAPGGSGMILGLWNTSFEPDENPYVLRLEVFDAAGKKITAMQFAQYGGDGTGNKPVPTITTDHLDLKFHIDNKPVTFDLGTPATDACGVVRWSPSLHVNLNVQAEQENKRVHGWRLQYVKGTDSNVKFLKGDEYKAGTSPVNEIVNADVLLKEPELQSTCAFALILDVWSHVRGNSGFGYAGQKIKAIAIERCNP